MEFLGAQAGQDAQRQAGANAVDLDEGAKEAPLAFGDEAEQAMGVLANREVSEQGDFRARFRQAVESGHGRVDLIADTTDIHQKRRRFFCHQHAAQKADHRLTSRAFAMRRRVWR